MASQPEYFEFDCKGFRPTLFCHLFSGDIHQYLTFVSVILIVVSVCTATGAWNWLIDPDTQKVSVFVMSAWLCMWQSRIPFTQISVSVILVWLRVFACLISLYLWLSFSGVFLLIVVEPSVLHHQLHHFDRSVLCWNTQTSRCTINVSFLLFKVPHLIYSVGLWRRPPGPKLSFTIQTVSLLP